MNFKKYMAVLIVVISIFVIHEIKYYFVIPNPNIVYSKNLDTSNMDKVISDYILNNYFTWDNTANKKKFESHKVYGIKNRYGKQYVYIYTTFESYSFENNKLEMGPGGGNPILIIMKKDKDNKYFVINHKSPSELDGESYKTFFPRQYAWKINSDNSLSELLKNNIKKQLDKWLLSKKNDYNKNI